MTRKDYELIADTIRTDCPLSGRLRLAEAFALKLAEDNPRFDRERFIKAATADPNRIGKLDPRDFPAPARERLARPR